MFLLVPALKVAVADVLVEDVVVVRRAEYEAGEAASRSHLVLIDDLVRRCAAYEERLASGSDVTFPLAPSSRAESDVDQDVDVLGRIATPSYTFNSNPLSCMESMPTALEVAAWGSLPPDAAISDEVVSSTSAVPAMGSSVPLVSFL